jgi:hypothetical protein
MSSTLDTPDACKVTITLPCDSDHPDAVWDVNGRRWVHDVEAGPGEIQPLIAQQTTGTIQVWGQHGKLIATIDRNIKEHTS